jgi:Mn-containing catalase
LRARTPPAPSYTDGKKPFSIGHIPPTPKLVDQIFNDSTGVGDHAEHDDARGPWNSGNGWEFVEAPAFGEIRTAEGARAESKSRSAHR